MVPSCLICLLRTIISATSSHGMGSVVWPGSILLHPRKHRLDRGRSSARWVPSGLVSNSARCLVASPKSPSRSKLFRKVVKVSSDFFFGVCLQLVGLCNLPEHPLSVLIIRGHFHRHLIRLQKRPTPEPGLLGMSFVFWSPFLFGGPATFASQHVVDCFPLAHSSLCWLSPSALSFGTCVETGRSFPFPEMFPLIYRPKWMM